MVLLTVNFIRIQKLFHSVYYRFMKAFTRRHTRRNIQKHKWHKNKEADMLNVWYKDKEPRLLWNSYFESFPRHHIRDDA